MWWIKKYSSSIVWYLGERVSMCWELTDFCDVRRLADGRFSQSVYFLTWAPVSQVRTLRLCGIFLERRAAPPQEGWRQSIFNRSGLHQKVVQLSIKPTSDIVFASSHTLLTLFLVISKVRRRTSLAPTWITILLNLHLAFSREEAD